jgi:hypothetical protein
MAAQFERLIAIVAADPDIKLSALKSHFDRAAEEDRAASAGQLKQRFAEKLKTAKRRTAIPLDPATVSRS